VTTPRRRGEPQGAHQQIRNGGAVTDLVGDELERRRWFGLHCRGDTGGEMVKLMVKMSVRKQGRGVASFYRGGEAVVGRGDNRSGGGSALSRGRQLWERRLGDWR
jgi:hypothetical protein